MFTTCRVCLEVFASRKDQVAHFGSAWHVTNLRRVGAGLKPESEEGYEARNAREAAAEAQAEATRLQRYACEPCNKKFASLQALEQHTR